MARNQEKANSLLSLFLQKQQDPSSTARRPHLASDCHELSKCERWRRQILRDVARDVAAIQNAALGEHRIRELNDGINKLLREKKHWERQILLLGGPDYAAAAARVTDLDGRRALGTEGYLYFGAAKDLPGVRELFERRDASGAGVSGGKRRGELAKEGRGVYYGFRDEDDERLVAAEAEGERRKREKVEADAREEKEREEAALPMMGDAST